MVPYTEDMYQEATYWAPTEQVAFGVVELADPVLIACRWQDVSVQFRSPAGVLETSSAVVYPDRPLLVQGWIVLGDFSGVPGASGPRDLPGCREIRQTGSSPDLDAEEVLHKVWL